MDTALLRYERGFAKADAEGRRPHPNDHSLTSDRPNGTHRDTSAALVGAPTTHATSGHRVLNTRLYETTDGEGEVLF